MTVPTISNLPTVPATSDPNFETEAPALFNHIKNTFVSEMNSAISFINSSTFDATVEFKNADFTAARNFLYMIDTSSGGVSVTLPANPSTGDQLLLMDQKRSFGTNNLTIGRNSQNINGAASDVVSKSTGALIRCIFQSSYGWTVDLYEGEWESGTSAGDLVYNGGNVGIGTTNPSCSLNVENSNDGHIAAFEGTGTNGGGRTISLGVGNNDVSELPTYQPYIYTNASDSANNSLALVSEGGTAATGGIDFYTGIVNDVEHRMRITRSGTVGIGTNAPASPLHVAGTNSGSDLIALNLTNKSTDDGTATAIRFTNSSITENFLSGEIAVMRQSDGSNDLRLNLKNSNSTPTYPRMLTIDGSTGNVGIGTSAPNKKLHVTDSNEIVATLTNSTNAAATKTLLRFSQHTDSDVVSGNIGINRLGANQGCGFEINLADSTGAEQNRLTILEDGRVGIGTSSPAAGTLLHVQGVIGTTNGTAAAPTHSFYGDPDNGMYRSAVNQLSFSTAGTQRLTIDSTGNVGIGTSAPQAFFNIAMPDGTSVGTLYTSKRSFDDSANRVDLIYQYEYSSSGGITSGSRISFAKESTTDGHYGSDLRFITRESGQTFLEKMRITGAGNVEVKTGNLVIGTAGKGIDFSVNSHATGMTSELFDAYETGSFTPAFIDTNGDASFTHDVQKGRYTKIGNCVYFQLFIGTDAVTEGTGNLKISGLPFTAQNTDGQLTPSSSVGLNYSWDTSPIKWSIASNSDAIILYKSVNPLTPSASTDLRTTANTNRISIEGFYHV